jgi:hypothetical protein
MRMPQEGFKVKMEHWNEYFRGIGIMALFLGSLSAFFLLGSASESTVVVLKPVFLLLFFPIRISLEPESKVLLCLFLVSFCWFFSRLRNFVYSYLYLAFLISVGFLFMELVQYYPSIDAFDRLYGVMTDFHLSITIFFIVFLIIVTSKCGVLLFLRYPSQILVYSGVAAFVSWGTLFTWLCVSMTPEFSLFILNTDLLFFFYCVMLLSLFLDVWVLDSESTKNPGVNMLTAMGTNGLGYCLMLSIWTYVSGRY